MYKKMIAGVSLGALLMMLLFARGLEKVKFSLFNPVSPVISEEVWNEKERVERFDFGTLYCNGIPVATDYIEKTFYVPLNMETESWETLEFNCPDPELKIVFSEDFTKHDKKQAIAEGKDHEFLIYNDTQFSTYHMIFTGLPVISLTTSEGIENQKEIAGSAAFYDINFSSQGISTSDYHGHVRGNTSTLYPKKGYKINLTKQRENGITEKNKLSVFDLRRDDDWILYAMYNDPSKLRVKLSTDLWNEFGAKQIFANSVYNTNVQYVELLVDDSYYGMYALMEPIDAKQMNLGREDYLYKRKEQNELVPEPFLQSRNPEEEVLGFAVKAGEADEKVWLPMAHLSELLTASDEEFSENAGNVIDGENAMRLWLYLQVITGVDQVHKNAFYVAKREGDQYRFYFAPWDTDLTWGNISSSESPYYTVFSSELCKESLDWEPGNRLVRLNVDGAQEKMQELYGKLRDTVLSEKGLEERVNRLNEQIRNSGAYERNHARWPEEAYTEDISDILNYAKERMEYLDSALYDLDNY